SEAERRHGLDRHAIAREMVFVSHETYTPARGGSAAAEVHALRRVFGDGADRMLVANTKGLTGHPMGVGLEDVVAIKALETGLVPPVPNFREVDPELGTLRLSPGGLQPVRYALRLAAGFGSQISMVLLRWTPVADGRRRHPEELGFDYRVEDRARWDAWLRDVTGQEAPSLEVVQHRLRVADGVVARPPAKTAEPAPPAEPAPAPTPVAAEPAPEPVAAAPVPAPAPEPSADAVLDRVLAVVAEQTGYPVDLLDPELDLEADLGIDTVKQAEVFAAIRETYGIERDDSLKLRDYPTLASVVAFVRERTGGAEARPVEAAPASPAPEGVATDLASDDGAIPRRVPIAVVRPPLDACVPTGVDLDVARVVLASDAGGVAAALAASLGERGAAVFELDVAAEAEAVEAQLAAWAADGPITGVFWLPALDEPALDALDPAAWHEALRRRVKLLAVTMRALPPEAFLVSATRLGGRHGYDAAGATGTLGGAVCGFTKALARERASATIKVVDFGDAPEADVAAALVAEALRDPGVVEAGHADGLRWSVGLAEEAARPDPARALTKDTTFLVTGAAGSIVAAITADLAVASGGTFHLVDLVPAPDPADPDAARSREDRADARRAILLRHGESVRSDEGQAPPADD
ncbi:MAG: hypothetical protein HZB46_10145, partial [Solirubrobacterales bacterium]|nr:hypothetical protein [Solirubrobacterales bacterium]